MIANLLEAQARFDEMGCTGVAEAVRTVKSLPIPPPPLSSVAAAAARWDDCLEFAQVQIADVRNASAVVPS